MLLEVIMKHTSNFPNPISFKIGDELVTGIHDDEFVGWVKVTTKNGNQGWAPEQYIDMSSVPAVAIENYSANELNVDLGEILEFIHELNEWVWVKNKTGKFGWVPGKTTKCV